MASIFGDFLLTLQRLNPANFVLTRKEYFFLEKLLHYAVVFREDKIILLSLNFTESRFFLMTVNDLNIDLFNAQKFFLTLWLKYSLSFEKKDH